MKTIYKLLEQKSWKRNGLILVFLVVFLQSAVTVAQEPISRWSRPIDITQPSSSTNALFGQILCDQYQNLHLLWADMTPKGAAVFYRTDAGGDWSIPVDVVAMKNPVFVRLSAVITKDDEIHLIGVNQWILGTLFYTHAPLQRAGDVRAWSEPVPLATHTELGTLATDAEGTLHLVYGASDDQGLDIALEYINSTDGGESWSAPVEIFNKQVTTPSDADGRIAVDGAGRIHVGITVRSQEYSVYSEVGYVRSADGGRTWSDYRQIDNRGTAFQGVNTMTPYAFGENEVHLTWHDPRRMDEVSYDGGETWSQPVEVMPLGAAFGGENALAKDSSGVVYMVMAQKGGVYSASFNGTEWGDVEQIDSRGIDPHGQNIAVCQGNQVHIIFDDRNDEKKIWYSTRTVAAQPIPRQPMPSLPELPLVEASPMPSLEPTARSPWQGSTGQVSGSSGLPDPLSPVVWPIVPVILIIAVIFAVSRRR